MNHSNERAGGYLDRRVWVCQTRLKYVTRHNFYFLYKWISQYSNSYWSGNQAYLLERLADQVGVKIESVWDWGQRNDYDAVHPPYTWNFHNDDLAALNDALKKQSMINLAYPAIETSVSHRVKGKHHTSTKVNALSLWAREYIQANYVAA